MEGHTDQPGGSGEIERVPIPGRAPWTPERAARKRGGGIEKAYSLAARLEEALALARREATSRADRAELAEAEADLHRLRDKINHVLGGQ